MNGEINDAIWNVDDGTMTIKFSDPLYRAIGSVVYPDCEIPDGEYGVSDSTELLKVINLMDKTLQVTTQPLLIQLSDGEIDVDVHLSDPMTIISEYDDYVELFEHPCIITTVFDSEFMENFIKKQRVTKTENLTTFTISETLNQNLEFSIGSGRKIRFKLEANRLINKMFTGCYNLQLFSDTLSANKECPEGRLQIYEYFCKLDFMNPNGIESTYLFIQQESKE